MMGLMEVNAGDEAEGQAPPRDLDALFREHADPLFRTLCAFTGGRTDIAADAAAEAFARIAAHPDTLRDPAAWIYRVAFRVAIDELRRETKQGELSASVGSTPAPELEGVMAALSKLPPNQRAAVTLRYVLELDTAEIAARMGIARPTVRVHLLRARKRLGELLGVQEVD